MHINSLTIRNLWSFGSGELRLEGFGKVNVLIGRNNSGKSNILRALRLPVAKDAWLQANDQEFLTWDQNELHSVQGTTWDSTEREPSAIIGFEPSKADMLRLQIECVGGPSYQELDKTAATLCQSLTLRLRHDWNREIARRRLVTIGPEREVGWPNGWATRGVQSQDIGFRLARLLSGSIVYVSGWRRLLDKEQFWEVTKGGARTGSQITLSALLHRYANPKSNELSFRRIFDSLQDFFRRLTGLPNAEIIPARDEENVNIKDGKRFLPLDSFGDGIQHVLLLAMAVARHEGKVILLEEPETHLHHELQRHLLEFIRSDGRNQFFITTHSPVFLDSRLADRVYRVEHDSQQTTVHHCQTSPELYRVLDQLDVRASDLLQANVAIWVEGPTDRMFLRRCLQLRDPDLVEGRDYQFVFYGGRVGSHFQVGDANDQLVNMLRLARRIVLVCDSDMSTPIAELNPTKKRLLAECTSAEGLAWVTAGREIENYLSDDAIGRTLQRLLGEAATPIGFGQWDRLHDVLSKFSQRCPEGLGWVTNYGCNKSRMMMELLADLREEDLSHLDLKSRLDELVKHIRQASAVSLAPMRA